MRIIGALVEDIEKTRKDLDDREKGCDYVMVEIYSADLRRLEPVGEILESDNWRSWILNLGLAEIYRLLAVTYVYDELAEEESEETAYIEEILLKKLKSKKGAW